MISAFHFLGDLVLVLNFAFESLVEVIDRFLLKKIIKKKRQKGAMKKKEKAAPKKRKKKAGRCLKKPHQERKRKTNHSSFEYVLRVQSCALIHI